MIFKKTLLLLTLMLTVSLAYSQGKEELKAMEALELNEYASAIDLFKDAFVKTKDPVRIANISFYTGIAYMRKNEPKQAEKWFEKAIKVKYPDPIAVLYMADMQKKNGDFEEAIKTYAAYGKLVPNDEKAKIGIESCEMAARWIEKPTRYVVENMPLFNSKDMDFSPTWGKKDYRIVLFSSTRSGSKGDETHAVTGFGFTDIYTVTQDRKGKWSEPAPMPGETVNTDNDEGASTVTEKGTMMYFTRCEVEKNRSLGCKIYEAPRRGISFEAGEAITFPGSDTASYGHPSIDSKEMTLYFAADLPGGYGGKDIWMMTRSKKTSPFGEPINLGPEINTPGNEVYPVIRSNGELYFSSDYHAGMGGLDIFKAVLDKASGKYTVSNMKYPINSPADDFGIIFKGNSEQGFFTSSRPGGKGAEDIYQFNLPPLQFTIKGVVKDEKTEIPLVGAKVELRGSDGTAEETITAADGSYEFKLKPNVDYQLLSKMEKYLNGKGGESTKGIEEDKDFVVDISMKPIWKPIKIPNILYEYTKADLLPESMASLDNLVEILNDNPNIIIELGSHTDFRGSDQANRELAQKRAQSVVDYLITKGIAKERLVAKGYGEAEPASVSKEDADRYEFLKEGDVLTEQFIKTLATVEEQEVAHQMNRRTELKVLKTDYPVAPTSAVSVEGDGSNVNSTEEEPSEEGEEPTEEETPEE
ncbi:MAG: OmpA family protein [Bacteroidales bacterium]|nr:OmpA family protein [Bacteroidales bacterium]